MINDRAYYQDWCCYSFRELAVCQFYFLNMHAVHPFQEYVGLNCFQCIEKILKALIIKKNKIELNKELKKYSHNLNFLIRDINIGPRQRISLYKEFSKIGKEFHNSFGLYKTKVNYSNTKHFSSDEFEKYGFGLRCYSLFLDVLKCAYLEIRYPKHEKLSDLYSMNLNIGVYLNIPILIATIRTFKVIQNYLGKSADKHLWQNFTWSHVHYYFDEPEDDTIDTYQHMEEMIRFILNKNETMQIREYIIEKDVYYRTPVTVRNTPPF